MAGAAVAPSPSNNLEAKILQAASEAGQVAGIFSPAAAEAINAGVAVEPVFSGFVQLILGIFKHHTKVGQ